MPPDRGGVSRGIEVGQDGQHPAVVVVGGGQIELAEDAGDVLGDGTVTEKQPLADGGVADRPSAISESTSRSRGVSRSTARLRLNSLAITSGSIAVPPPATRRTASMNWSPPSTRSFSR